MEEAKFKKVPQFLKTHRISLPYCIPCHINKTFFPNKSCFVFMLCPEMRRFCAILGRFGGSMTPWPPAGSANAMTCCGLSSPSYGGTVLQTPAPLLLTGYRPSHAERASPPPLAGAMGCVFVRALRPSHSAEPLLPSRAHSQRAGRYGRSTTDRQD